MNQVKQSTLRERERRGGRREGAGRKRSRFILWLNRPADRSEGNFLRPAYAGQIISASQTEILIQAVDGRLITISLPESPEP